MHQVIAPKILYFGTPVVLISTLNQDGSTNLAPISSVWWMGQSCMLGMGTRSQTVENLRHHAECVLNLPSSDMVTAVDRLALTTGRNPVPDYKIDMNFQYEPDKFGHAGLTRQPAHCVAPSRVQECPVQLEGQVRHIHPFGPNEYACAIEVAIVRVHVEEHLLNNERRHHIDPDRWHPLIMSFCEFYGLGGKLHPSRLAKVF